MMDRDEMKTAVKEALKEWLNEKAATFGWWSIATIASLALAALVYFILASHGWKPPVQ